MKADNTTKSVYKYKAIKVNKTSIIYEIDRPEPIKETHPEDYLTNLIKIEKDQGFSKANVCYWLRVRNESNWNKCETPTGLFRTLNPKLYHGDIKTNKGKTLILFYFDEVNNLQIFTYQNGFYPDRKQLEFIIKNFS